ncbi:MAG: sulfite exporter TauE/SafE family protein [Acidobacteriota bacterium]
MPVSLSHFALLLTVALIGGIANALAGGGTFLVFPTLMLSGLDAIVANATSAATMLPGGAASAWVYRKGSEYDRKLLRWLIAMSILGGITGSILVLLTPSARFAKMVPYLMLSAALVFTFSGQIQRAAASHISDKVRGSINWVPLIIGHYLISAYGGYFGAGMGVLMIVLYTLTANLDVQQSAALRFYCTLGINGPAVMIFALRGAVDWKLSIPMAIAAVAGGYWGAHLVRKMSVLTARRAVLVFAWAISIWLLLR